MSDKCFFYRSFFCRTEKNFIFKTALNGNLVICYNNQVALAERQISANFV